MTAQLSSTFAVEINQRLTIIFYKYETDRI